VELIAASTRPRVVLASELLGIIRRTGPQESDDGRRFMSSGLVEYFVLAVPDQSGVATITQALEHLIAQGTIRVLDLVVVEHVGDQLVIREPEPLANTGSFSDGVGGPEGVLSHRDISLSSSALPPHAIGVIVVTEDRWAEPLILAAQTAGGRIVGGDRVPARSSEASFVDDPFPEGGD
jgi:hypothetical protein